MSNVLPTPFKKATETASVHCDTNTSGGASPSHLSSRYRRHHCHLIPSHCHHIISHCHPNVIWGDSVHHHYYFDRPSGAEVASAPDRAIKQFQRHELQREHSGGTALGTPPPTLPLPLNMNCPTHSTVLLSLRRDSVDVMEMNEGSPPTRSHLDR